MAKKFSCFHHSSPFRGTSSFFETCSNDSLVSSPLFCELVANARNSLELRWSAFFSAWGIPFDYNSEGSGIYGLDDLPDFFVPGVNTWVEIRAQSEQDEISSIVDPYSEFVWRTKQVVLILFGAPRVQIPKAQGWGLRLLRGELVVIPIHLTECPCCGGFRADGVGSIASRKQRPARFREVVLGAQTPKLQRAYAISRHPRLMLH